MDLIDDLAIDRDARGRVDLEIGGVLGHLSAIREAILSGLLYQYSNTLDIGQGTRLKLWKVPAARHLAWQTASLLKWTTALPCPLKRTRMPLHLACSAR